MRLKKTGIMSLLILTLLALGTPIAFAQSPPTVQTLKPTKMYVYYGGSYVGSTPTIQDVRATLNGTVNPNGSNCSVYFDYGTTTAYGSVADATPTSVSGSSLINVSVNLTNLRVNTVYHCRLVAVTDSSISYGHDLAFIPNCEPYEIYQYNRTQLWNSRFFTSSDPTGNIEIVASPNDSPTWTYFDIVNHNSFDVFVNYTDMAGDTSSGTVVVGTLQDQLIYVPKASICSFSYNYTLFKQVMTNDQNYNETPLPQNKVEMYFLGYLSGNQVGVYSINNRNAQAVSLDMQAGSSIYPVSVPANGIVYFIAPSGTEVQASYNNVPFMIVSPAGVKWYGSALVTANPLDFNATTATFELQNNDDTAHQVKLKNASGVTHAYSLAPYAYQTVTIEKSDWDIYLQMSDLPQPNIAGLVEDGYVKINSVSPGTPPAKTGPLVSQTAVSMVASAGSSSLVQVWGSDAWTASSDKPWLAVSPASGSGKHALTFTAEANPTTAIRSATVTVADSVASKTVTVTQGPGGQNNALSFDGVNDSVSIPDNDASLTDAFTLETWVKWEPGSASDIQFICGKQLEQMELQTAGGGANGIRFIPTPGVYLDAANVLPTGVWTHVAVVYKPSASLAKMYINGNEVALTKSGSQPITSALANSPTGFSLGCRSDGSYPFKGALDDFRIWNRALTQNEIRLNLANPFDAKAQTGLVSAYSFNEGFAGGDNTGFTTLPDETGSYNGVLNNFALSGASSNWVTNDALSGVQGYNVTYDGNGATSGTVPIDSLRYISGATATVKDAAGFSKTGSSFGGWNTAADGSGTNYSAGTSFDMGSSNITLYAQWTAIPTYNVTYDGNSSTGGSVPTDSSNYTTGAAITILGNTGGLVKTGSTFTGWNTAANGSGTSYATGATLTMGAANVTLYAQWTANSTTTPVPPTITPSGGTITASQTISITDPNISSVSNSVYYTLNGSTPTLQSYLYTVPFVLSQSATVTAAVYAGSTGLWSTSSSATFTITSGSTSSARDITGFTAPGQVGASVISTGSHTVSFHMPYGTNVTALSPVVTVSDGATITPLSGAAQNFSSPVAYTVTAQDGSAQNWTVTCLVGQGTRTVSVVANPPAGGAVSGGGTYNEGASVTVTAYVYSGYNFVNWTENNAQVSANSAYTFTMGTADRNLTANFVTVTTAVYSVNVSANPAAGGTVSGGGTYAQGATVTVTAAPNSGYSFVNWTEGGTPVSNSASYTFTMVASDRTLAANFSTITHHTGGGGSTPPQPVNSTTGLAMVNPAAGGTVGLGSNVTVSISANALQGSSSVQVAVQKVDIPPPAPSGFMIMGTGYQFTVNGQDHYNFNQPVTLTFTFDPSKLAPGETPAVYYYDETKGQWANIGGMVSGNTITVTVDHFTKYAVMAVQSGSPAQKPAIILSDIAGHWAEANINKLVAMGAISGYPDGTFKPDNNITRGEFATFLVKAFKLASKQGRAFADTANSWTKDYISTAAAYGIVNGYDDSRFGPDDPITREQMTAMVVKAAKLSPVNEQLSFNDSADISVWAKEAVAAAVKDGIMKGYPDNTFRPKGNATRAEAVTVIVNAINLQ